MEAFRLTSGFSQLWVELLVAMQSSNGEGSPRKPEHSQRRMAGLRFILSLRSEVTWAVDAPAGLVVLLGDEHQPLGVPHRVPKPHAWHVGLGAVERPVGGGTCTKFVSLSEPAPSSRPPSKAPSALKPAPSFFPFRACTKFSTTFALFSVLPAAFCKHSHDSCWLTSWNKIEHQG